MAYCQKCNTFNADGAPFCGNCGAPMSAPVQVQPMYVPELTQEQLPPKFKPLGAWSYFGFSLLFSIPLVGLILLIVFACGGTQNINLRNYARSFFCVYALFLILILVLLLAGASFSGIASLF